MTQNSLRNTLQYQVSTIVSQHVEHLGQFISLSEPWCIELPEAFTAALDRLLAIYEYAPETSSTSLYQEIHNCYLRVQSFLTLMNQPLDAAFENTELGTIWFETERWCGIAEKHCRPYAPPLKEIWSLIAPAQPDVLQEVKAGVYEALWRKPVPMMDIEILLHTEGVDIIGRPQEPENVPGGIALKFTTTYTSHCS